MRGIEGGRTIVLNPTTETVTETARIGETRETAMTPGTPTETRIEIVVDDIEKEIRCSFISG